VDETHPIFTGPFTPVSEDINGYYVADGWIEGSVTPLIVDEFDTTKVLLAEKEWGDGKVMFGTLGVPDWLYTVEESQNLLQNIIDYLKLCAPVDLGIVELISPAGGCGMTSSDSISVTVENFGPSTVSSFPVQYTIDGGGIVSETAVLTITSGTTATYTFATTGDLSAPGDHEVCVWTNFSGDEDPGNDTLCVTITSLATPTLDFGANMTVCDAVTLDAGNPGSSYVWSTGETTQTIAVTTSGTYSVTITDPTSGCEVTDEVTVTVNYSPEASFTYTVAGTTVTFTNTSTPGSTYFWDFGDAQTSTTTNPEHDYGASGSYTVTLTVTNPCGSVFIFETVNVAVGVEDLALENAVSVYPNPTSDHAVVDINLSVAEDLTLQLVNTLGQVVWSAIPGTIATATFEIDMTNFADGVYQLNITSDGKSASKQIVLAK
jgi:PKD repeat protein